jgi:hypothetical protein
MRKLKTYEGAVVLVGPEMCVVEEERRDALANYDYDTEDLEPLDGNNTTLQCAKDYESLVAFAFRATFGSMCICKWAHMLQRITLIGVYEAPHSVSHFQHHRGRPPSLRREGEKRSLPIDLSSIIWSRSWYEPFETET